MEMNTYIRYIRAYSFSLFHTSNTNVTSMIFCIKEQQEKMRDKVSQTTKFDNEI